MQNKFFSYCAGISMVLIAASLFVFSIRTTIAAPKAVSLPQSGTAENYIPLGISNGYGYWIIFNTSDGYKFRKAKLEGGKFEEK